MRLSKRGRVRHAAHASVSVVFTDQGSESIRSRADSPAAVCPLLSTRRREEVQADDTRKHAH